MLVVRKTKRYMTFLSLILVFVVIMSTEARAEMFGFFAVTANSTVDPGYAEAQLSLDVTDEGSNQVKFTFINDDTIPGPQQMFIRNVYFYDGGLALNSILSSTGVAFSSPSNPQDLPGYDEGILTTFLMADSDVQNKPPGDLGGWGIDLGQHLSVIFDISSPATYNYDMLISDIKNSTVVIGIHVQGFADGESESLITPIPGAFLLGILGLGVAGLKLRKFT